MLAMQGLGPLAILRNTVGLKATPPVKPAEPVKQ
jgi:hypothetical protein